MIYEFENKELLLKFKEYLPTLRKIVYSDDAGLFLLADKQITYPSLYFNRKPEQWTMSKSYTAYLIKDGVARRTKFFIVPVSYEGIILVEKQADAISLMHDLRFAWEKSPYLVMGWPNVEDEFKVELRLTSLGIETERDPKSEIGSQRLVKFTWNSQLFIAQNSNVAKLKGFIIHLYNNDNELKIIDNYAGIS